MNEIERLENELASVIGHLRDALQRIYGPSIGDIELAERLSRRHERCKTPVLGFRCAGVAGHSGHHHL